MSISDQITYWVTQGELVPMVPPRKGLRRWMYLDRKLDADLKAPPPGAEAIYSEMRAELTSFVTQRWITPEYLWLLKPKNRGVWEIKVRRNDPQVRVFGQFADKDLFVALSYRYRDDLGPIDDSRWKFEIKSVEHRWRELFFGQYHAKTTPIVDELFDGAINAKYFYD